MPSSRVALSDKSAQFPDTQALSGFDCESLVFLFEKRLCPNLEISIARYTKSGINTPFIPELLSERTTVCVESVSTAEFYKEGF